MASYSQNVLFILVVYIGIVIAFGQDELNVCNMMIVFAVCFTQREDLRFSFLSLDCRFLLTAFINPFYLDLESG